MLYNNSPGNPIQGRASFKLAFKFHLMLLIPKSNVHFVSLAKLTYFHFGQSPHKPNKHRGENETAISCAHVVSAIRRDVQL